MTEAEIAAARRAYAEELRFTARLRSPEVVRAFATVPREDFVGPGPWRIKSPMAMAEYWTTDGADPRSVYHDVLIALDETRNINNGQPLLWSFLFDQLATAPGLAAIHLGCGTGYYTAIMAELVGATGTIHAIELDAGLADRARQALAPWPQIVVENADAAHAALPPADLVIASAGATHPLPSWLDALRPGGRLLFPLTPNDGRLGGMLLITRRTAGGYAARFLSGAAFIDMQGARDPDTGQRLEAAFARDRGRPVQTLRRDAHAADGTCWLHGAGWCVSMVEPAEIP